MREIGSPSGEGTFEYGLCLIVDGIRTVLRSHTASRTDEAALDVHQAAR